MKAPLSHKIKEILKSSTDAKRLMDMLLSSPESANPSVIELKGKRYRLVRVSQVSK